MGRSARFRNKYIGCNTVPSLTQENTSMNSLIRLQWTADLEIYFHCLLKCTETQNNEVLLFYHTELQSDMHVQSLHYGVLGTEPQSLSQGISYWVPVIPAGILSFNSQIFSERPLSFSLQKTTSMSVGEERLVGLTLPRCILTVFAVFFRHVWVVQNLVQVLMIGSLILQMSLNKVR